MRVLANLEQQIKLLRKERVVIFQAQPEERVGLHERAAAGDDLGAAMRDQVQRGEFLEDAHRVRGAQNGDGARQPDVFRARGRRGQNHDRRGIQKLRPVMLADAENVEAHVVGKLDLLEQMLHALHGTERETCGRVGDSRCEAVDPDLHLRGSRLPVERWMTRPTFWSQLPLARGIDASGLEG